jgi:hypothetical protein
MSKKRIEVELSFIGSGVIETEGGGFHGGVVAPALTDLRFKVHRQVVDEDGYLNPVAGEDSVEGSFQINIRGGSAGYRELGRYFLGLAELDTSADEGFHEHFDQLRSEDGRTHLHVIIRKEEHAN